MIKLSDNRVALMNLNVTIEAIENLDKLIKEYSVNVPGPAYCKFERIAGDTYVQFERSIMVEALNKQREHLSKHMKNLGIDIDN